MKIVVPVQCHGCSTPKDRSGFLEGDRIKTLERPALFLTSLSHEFCHHLDFKKFGFVDSMAQVSF